MRICHITPHLPPDQAANALLPFHLGRWAADAGHDVEYVAHPPRAGVAVPQPGPVTWVPSRHGSSSWARRFKVASTREAWRIMRDAAPVLARADVVHVHSNGLLAEMGALFAKMRRKPVVLTLYGTEIWHYRRRNLDLFTRMYRRADRITFYSRLLLERAREYGLDRAGLGVVYPPVPETFTCQNAPTRERLRATFGIREQHLLVNVKRLHPLADQRTLIEAMPAVVGALPDTRLVVCGAGPLREELEGVSLGLGVAKHVTFTGLVDNHVVAQYCATADVFVLPSLLEALPTVAVEALASGTPVVSTDNPGGLELHALFDDDVEVVRRGDKQALAVALIARLTNKRRTSVATAGVLDREFRPRVVWRRFLGFYEDAIGRRRWSGPTA